MTSVKIEKWKPGEIQSRSMAAGKSPKNRKSTLVQVIGNQGSSGCIRATPTFEIKKIQSCQTVQSKFAQSKLVQVSPGCFSNHKNDMAGAARGEVHLRKVTI